jgi:hypothetical protein
MSSDIRTAATRGADIYGARAFAALVGDARTPATQSIRHPATASIADTPADASPRDLGLKGDDSHRDPSGRTAVIDRPRKEPSGKADRATNGPDRNSMKEDDDGTSQCVISYVNTRTGARTAIPPDYATSSGVDVVEKHSRFIGYHLDTERRALTTLEARLGALPHYCRVSRAPRTPANATPTTIRAFAHPRDTQSASLTAALTTAIGADRPSGLSREADRLCRWGPCGPDPSDDAAPLYEDDDGCTTLDLQYVRGESLHDVMRRPDMTREQLASLIIQLLLAVEAMHGATGISHNDLHLDNVIVAPTDTDYFAYVFDSQQQSVRAGCRPYAAGRHCGSTTAPSASSPHRPNDGCYVVRTYGRCVVIIDFGLAFVPDGERMEMPAWFTDIGYFPFEADLFGDARLALSNVIGLYDERRRSKKRASSVGAGCNEDKRIARLISAMRRILKPIESKIDANGWFYDETFYQMSETIERYLYDGYDRAPIGTIFEECAASSRDGSDEEEEDSWSDDDDSSDDRGSSVDQLRRVRPDDRSGPRDHLGRTADAGESDRYHRCADKPKTTADRLRDAHGVVMDQVIGLFLASIAYPLHETGDDQVYVTIAERHKLGIQNVDRAGESVSATDANRSTASVVYETFVDAFIDGAPIGEREQLHDLKALLAARDADDSVANARHDRLRPLAARVVRKLNNLVVRLARTMSSEKRVIYDRLTVRCVLDVVDTLIPFAAPIAYERGQTIDAFDCAANAKRTLVVVANGQRIGRTLLTASSESNRITNSVV